MNHTVQFRPAAQLELNQGADWYDSKQKGLGVRFVLAIDSAVKDIVDAPTRSSFVYKEVRLQSVKGFPYQVYYRIVENTMIEVLSIFHVRQNPMIWKARI